MVLTCLDPESPAVAITDDRSGAPAEAGPSMISVKHVLQHEHDDLSVWVWESGESLCVTDLSDADLELLGRFAESIRRHRVRMATRSRSSDK